jgi:hypothetical protein
MKDTQNIIDLIESLLDAKSILEAIEEKDNRYSKIVRDMAQAECEEHLAVLDWRMRMRELEEKVRD